VRTECSSAKEAMMDSVVDSKEGFEGEEEEEEEEEVEEDDDEKKGEDDSGRGGRTIFVSPSSLLREELWETGGA